MGEKVARWGERERESAKEGDRENGMIEQHPSIHQPIDRWIGRETDRQTGRQTGRQTDRPTDRQTDRPTDRSPPSDRKPKRCRGG